MKQVLTLLLCMCFSLLLLTGTAMGDMDTNGAGAQEKNAVCQEMNEVYVDTIDEFLDAVADRTIIHLGGLEYKLAEASDYGKSRIGACSWLETEDGSALQIKGVTDLMIQGEGATLIAENGNEDVISFESCSGLGIVGLTMKHSEQDGESIGCVLRLTDCDYTTLGDCRFVNGGTVGINAIACTDIYTDFCEFTDCTEGGGNLYACKGIYFTRNWIHDCGSPALSISNCSEVFWDGTELPGDFCTTDMNIAGDTPLALLSEEEDPVTVGGISYRFPAESEVFRIGDFDVRGVLWQVTFPEWEICTEVSFYPGWLPFAVDASSGFRDLNGWYSRLVSENVEEKIRPAPYRDMGQPFMIEVYYAAQLAGGGLLFSLYTPGSIEFETIGEWEALKICAFDEFYRDGYYIILYSPQYGYILVISGQCPMEDLETIAENLDVYVTRNAVFRSDFSNPYALVDIAVG